MKKKKRIDHYEIEIDGQIVAFDVVFQREGIMEDYYSKTVRINSKTYEVELFIWYNAHDDTAIYRLEATQIDI